MKKDMSFEEMQTAIESIKSSKNKIVEDLDNVKGKMAQIRDPEVWESPAAKKMQEDFQRLSTTFESFPETVNAFAAFATHAINVSRENEQANIKKQSTVI